MNGVPWDSRTLGGGQDGSPYVAIDGRGQIWQVTLTQYDRRSYVISRPEDAMGRHRVRCLTPSHSKLIIDAPDHAAAASALLADLRTVPGGDVMVRQVMELVLGA